MQEEDFLRFAALIAAAVPLPKSSTKNDTPRDDVFKIAKECGLDPHRYWHKGIKNALLDFAACIAEAEREACAKVCDALPFLNADQCATAIRMRGEEK